MNTPAIFKASHKRKNPEIISYKNMRKCVGILAMLLPVLTMGGYMLLGAHQIIFLDSISEYYYTLMRDVFVGTLCMVGLFLFAYKGYDDMENRVFNVAAILCILIAFFSMNPQDYRSCFRLWFNNNVAVSHYSCFGYIHLTAASILFIILGYVSNNLFTKTDKSEDPTSQVKPTGKKITRNTIYKFCGRLIWLSLAVYVIYSGVEKIFADYPFVSTLENFQILFVVETVCLEAFGFSWLVKGEGIGYFND
jgi:hypothetical protein